MTDEARAREFIAKLAGHEFAAAVAMFDDTLRGELPDDKLAALWRKIEQQFGTFVRVDTIDFVGRTARAKSTFTAAPLVLKISFRSDGRIGGFFYALGDTATSWQPPSYANPDAFEEREVKVGRLPGTLTIPKGIKHFPVVVLVHGSGPNDRDETIGQLKPFKDLALGLASRGIAVLRYDKRTHVDPAGVRTQKDEVDDAAHAAIQLVRALPDVDAERIALLGHSQGGYLAPRIAKDDPAIKRLVILAGSTRSLADSLLAQVRYLEPANKDAIAAIERFKAAVEDPKLGPDDSIQVPFASTISGAYFLEVRDYHPERVAAKLAIPLLVLQGERDYQVTVADDFAAWKTTLASRKNATLKTYPGLNHTFTRGTGPPSRDDYLQPGNVDASVIDDIASWLTK
jgi:dienelactone hydrolase